MVVLLQLILHEISLTDCFMVERVGGLILFKHKTGYIFRIKGIALLEVWFSTFIVIMVDSL